MRSQTIAIIGSGSLARAACQALIADVSLTSGQGIEVVLLARDNTAAAGVCAVAGSLAALAGRRARFSFIQADLGDPVGIAEALHAADPAGVVLCASYQSPWERLTAPSRWTDLLGRAGFGLSLPLQAAPAIGVGEAMAKTCPSAWFVNACFPDAVNPVLFHRGVPVTCGAGNVAMLGAALALNLGLTDIARLKMVAHHVHLHAPSNRDDEAMAWVDDIAVADVTSALGPLRQAPRASLVNLAGASAAQVAAALLTGDRLDTQLPGPLGLPGGYPVRIEGGRLSLRLPAGYSEAEAVAFNQRAAIADGVAISDGRVTFSPAVSGELRPELADLAEGFAIADIVAACDRLLELRARLRLHPRPGGRP